MAGREESPVPQWRVVTSRVMFPGCTRRHGHRVSLEGCASGLDRNKKLHTGRNAFVVEIVQFDNVRHDVPGIALRSEFLGQAPEGFTGADADLEGPGDIRRER
jgi:hypothetical protein